MEAARLLPVLLAVLLYGVVGLAGLAVAEALSAWLAVVAVGVGLIVGGLVAAAVTTAAKWLLVGRLRPGTHPLWSSFVWRNELADTFVEVVAAPWFARGVTGTPLLTAWFRSMGAQVGRGVWCETYWLPEPDLVRLGDGRRSTRAASCRRTSSTTGCWRPTWCACGAARPSAPTG